MPDQVSLYQLLQSRYGSFLQTVRFHSQQDHLCSICGGIKSSNYDYCVSCSQMLNGSITDRLPIDHMAFGFYAMEGSSQFYTTVHDYKESLDVKHSQLLELILQVQIGQHLHCINEVGGAPLTSWAVIPSSQSSRRYGKPHPLATLVRRVLPELPEIKLQPTNVKTRTLRSDAFSLGGQVDSTLLRHVLLIDDSWVTGGSIESAALTLKQSGAQIVSAYCCARIVDGRYIQNTFGSTVYNGFIHNLPFIPCWCPWHRHSD